ncbi:hypothetical protein CYLTODRAFT_404336 [Cylindrobasidium torrendii FP15055 ss-10]|uniref:DUF6589 domain-containing protein n=1 Tax=Cylindrobasidium torrendii FP15055 ss-10 TaxID=1314674 RepID=A0A0D7AXJ2_9AGAR|nr:hypothetical protein CYLTODRAFT_404336 [Cylindrobasidium torrendii FP15055 ss-10]
MSSNLSCSPVTAKGVEGESGIDEPFANTQTSALFNLDQLLSFSPGSQSRSPSQSPPPSPLGHKASLSALSVRWPFEVPNPSTPDNSKPIDLVALTSSGPIASSPIRGRNKKERMMSRKQKGLKHRARNAEIRKKEKEVAKESKRKAQKEMSHVLALLKSNQVKFSELVFYVLDPAHKQGLIRYHEFLRPPSNVTRTLSLIYRASRDTVHDWTVGIVSRNIRREARAITASQALQTHHRALGGKFFTQFRPDNLRKRLQLVMPTTWKIITSVATNPKYEKSYGPARQARRNNVLTSSLMQLLSEWSQKNNLWKKVITLYCYATGAQRQNVEVLSHIGLAETYKGMTDTKVRHAKKTAASVTLEDIEEAAQQDACGKASVKKGTLRQLSDDMHETSKALASTGLFACVYDNINIYSKIAEQLIGRKDAQENGTTATIYPLWKANLSDMKTTELIDAFEKATPLEIDDIIHSPTESQDFRTCLVHTILRIIIHNGGPSFDRFRTELDKSQPTTDFKIDVHKTEMHPTPAWQIDESTIVGNAEFLETLYDHLGLRAAQDFPDTVRFVAGDQLSVTRIDSLVNIRAGQEGGFGGFRWVVTMLGNFHAKIADTHGFFEVHWGAGVRNPGSLHFHNTILDRIPITLSSLPPFQTCRDLIFLSLYARILDCLILISGKGSIDEIVTEETTFANLYRFAERIYERFVDVDMVEVLRDERANAKSKGKDPTKEKKGDMVFENAVLFLRDALISREFTDAIKAGDSGRVFMVLKVWALGFRGNGRTKYAYEMLSVIHRMTTVWPKPIVEIVMNNWLVNTTGNPNSFLEADRAQEHTNYWIKKFYNAHSSNASWDWLGMITPCIGILRDLTRSLNGYLGADLGTKHQSPDRTTDIQTLMTSLRRYQVHDIIRGRVLDGDAQVVDALTQGLATLTDGSDNPLDNYNATFVRLQSRQHLQPLFPVTPSSSTPVVPAPAASLSTVLLNDPDTNPVTSIVGDQELVSTIEVTENASDSSDDESEAEPEDIIFSGCDATLSLLPDEDVGLDMDLMDDFEDSGSELDSDVD